MIQKQQALAGQALDAARRGYGQGVDATRLATELHQRGWTYEGDGAEASAEECLDRASRGYGVGWDETRLAGALLECGWSFTG